MNEERGYVIYDPVDGVYTTSKGFVMIPFDRELIRAYIFRTYKSAENCEWYDKNRHQILPVSLSIICKPLEKGEQIMNKETFYIYGIYDTKQNKFRSDLTSRHKKWYESEKRARNALDDDRFSIGDLKIVKVECKIVEEINND